MARQDLPIGTEDIKVLLEDHVLDLELYADLSCEGQEIEGITTFFHSEKPAVRISKSLTANDLRQNRLRTTLTHELGHVVLHSPLTGFSRQQNVNQTSANMSSFVLACERRSIHELDRKPVDWMEWQAGYASGAFLMPKTKMEQVESDFRNSSGHLDPIYEGQTHALALESLVKGTFQVSNQAARVRLRQLKLLVE